MLVTLSTVVLQEWKDVNLEWDPELFSRITQVKGIPIKKIWKPDIHLLNEVGGYTDPTYQMNVVVNYSGNITYTTTAQFITQCSISMKEYPFDEHECQIQFGSWLYNEDEVRESQSFRTDAYLNVDFTVAEPYCHS